MKKVIIGAAVFVTALAAVRRFGPALHERCMATCQKMAAHVRASTPGERMMGGAQ